MNKPFFLFLALFFLPAAGAEAQLPLLSLPDSLKTGAGHVVVSDDTEFSVWSPQKAELKRKYKTVVLLPQGLKENTVALHYSSFSKIRSASLVISDGMGTVLKKYTLKDFEDWKSGWNEIASDARVKALALPEFSLPIVVEVEYAIEYKGSLFYPVWAPTGSGHKSVLQATFTLRDYSAFPLRHLASHLEAPEALAEPGATVLRWSVDSIPAEASEPLAKSQSPLLIIAPSVFEMDGHAGEMASWQAFGQWINQLNEGKNDLSQAQIAEIKKLTEGMETDREKVQAVYEYLRKNMRYVSIQLGIGSWQPFSASFVHEKKYGDCKALTFYAKSLLDALEIPSWYTLVRAGENENQFIQADFPSPYFNHAFLTVLLGQDTVWLECTSQTAPFGYLGSFTSDRNALLIDENGGRLIRTKAYSAEENVRQNTIHIHFQADGQVVAEVGRSLSGLEIERDGFYFVLNATSRDQENWLHDHIKGDVLEWRLKPVTDEPVPHTGFTLKTSLPAWNGVRIFAEPGDLIRGAQPDLPETKRKSPVLIRYPFTEQDSVVLSFPEGFSPESIPKPAELNFPFGTYQRQIEILDDRTCLLTRTFVLHKGVYPVEDYPAFREFIRETRRLDRQKLVWRKGG